jgi:hypothetical protein
MKRSCQASEGICRGRRQIWEQLAAEDDEIGLTTSRAEMWIRPELLRRTAGE